MYIEGIPTYIRVVIAHRLQFEEIALDHINVKDMLKEKEWIL